VDYACGGEIESLKKLKVGSILIKTKHDIHAKKLLGLTKIAGIDVTAVEHKAFNFSKGIIYCNELRYIDEATVLQKPKSQKVTEVRKIMKKIITTPTSQTTL